MKSIKSRIINIEPPHEDGTRDTAEVISCETLEEADEYIAQHNIRYHHVDVQKTMFSTEINKVWWSGPQSFSMAGTPKVAHFNSLKKELYIYNIHKEK